LSQRHFTSRNVIFPSITAGIYHIILQKGKLSSAISNFDVKYNLKFLQFKKIYPKILTLENDTLRKRHRNHVFYSTKEKIVLLYTVLDLANNVPEVPRMTKIPYADRHNDAENSNSMEAPLRASIEYQNELIRRGKEKNVLDDQWPNLFLCSWRIMKYLRVL